MHFLVGSDPSEILEWSNSLREALAQSVSRGVEAARASFDSTGSQGVYKKAVEENEAEETGAGADTSAPAAESEAPAANEVAEAIVQQIPQAVEAQENPGAETTVTVAPRERR